MIKSYLQKTKDIILNTPIEQLIEENKVKKKNAIKKERKPFTRPSGLKPEQLFTTLND